MSIYHHELTGCAPTPLAHYLKALGIFRLVAEQADPTARGFWKDESFHLVTVLPREELLKFFLETYSPTPMVSPWNKGSGFYSADDPALSPIEMSQAARLKLFQQGIKDSRKLLPEIIRADQAVRSIKNETKDRQLSKSQKDALKKSDGYKRRLAEADRSFKTLKDQLIPRLRLSWRGAHAEWLGAALVIGADNTPEYPSLLGTGGNDGRLDFTNNFMQRLNDVFDINSVSAAPRPLAHDLLTGSLFGCVTSGQQSGVAVGQFFPGAAGGANCTNGSEGDSALNPFDFILMMEGSILFAAQATKRLDSNTRIKASAPFAIHSASCGYASASKDETNSRGEQWMPLWEAPATLDDLRRLLAEGKVQIGKSNANRAVDFARAVARVGVAKGIVSFQRFGYLERNGQSNLAVPLGRWQVIPQPHQELLEDLDRFSWNNRLQRASRDDNAPASLAAAHRRLEDAVMAVCAQGSQASRWQSVLVALGECEAQLLRSGKFTKDKGLQPVPPLSAGWVVAADDGSPEYRLALALALQASDDFGRDPIRRHWLPLEKIGSRFAKGESGLAHDPAVVCSGLDPERDLIALVQRRLIEGAKGSGTQLPLVAAPRASATIADVAAFIEGHVDLKKVLELARPLMALNRRDAGLRMALTRVSQPNGAEATLPLFYALFRLSCLPWPLKMGEGEVPIRCDPAIYNRLASGDLSAAAENAIRRLKSSGVVPLIRNAIGDAALARQLAVSLAFPISSRSAEILADQLTKTQE
jgi:CRISPR-associated protein Csx17